MRCVVLSHKRRSFHSNIHWKACCTNSKTYVFCYFLESDWFVHLYIESDWFVHLCRPLSSSENFFFFACQNERAGSTDTIFWEIFMKFAIEIFHGIIYFYYEKKEISNKVKLISYEEVPRMRMSTHINTLRCDTRKHNHDR